jgi:hypothetical protein
VQPLGAHVTYGLKPYLTTRRTSALGQLVLNNIAPVISEAATVPPNPAPGAAVAVTVRVEDEDAAPLVFLHHRLNGTWQAPVPMLDDGLHQDGAAGDELYGVRIGPFTPGDRVEYYIRSVDAGSRQSVEPPDAPGTVFSFGIADNPRRLLVNEFMAKNDSTITDPFGEYEDWIEIYNSDTAAVWLGDKYLTDNLSNPTKWAFPDTTLPPGAFLVIWADEDGAQGPLHANFKLSRDGEQIGIFRGDTSGTTPVDTLVFGFQPAEVSMGRYPDGGWIWEFMGTPTPAAPNLVDRSSAVAAGWNLISVPMGVPDYRTSVLYPTAVSSAYMFDPVAHYVPRDTLQNGEGYWLKFGAADSLTITGTLLPRDSVQVEAGWNLIGSLSPAVATGSILQIPAGNVISPYYGFDGSYAIVTTLMPGGAYWVKCAGPGVLVLAPATLVNPQIH